MTEFAPPEHESARSHHPPPARSDRARQPPGSQDAPGRDDLGSLSASAGNRAVGGLFGDRRAPVDRHPDAPAGLREHARAYSAGPVVQRLFARIGELTNQQVNEWRAAAPTVTSGPPPVYALAQGLDVATLHLAQDFGALTGDPGTRQAFTAAATEELGDPAAVAACAATADGALAGALTPFWTAAQRVRDDPWHFIPQEIVKRPHATALESYADGLQVFGALQEQMRNVAFNAENARAELDDIDRMNEVLGLDAIYRTLRARPRLLHGALSIGYLRLLDENGVWDVDPGFPGMVLDKDQAEMMAITRDVFPSLHKTATRPGTLLAVPSGGATVGGWSQPKLDFAAFSATGSGVDTAGLGPLAGTAVGDLLLTVGFRIKVASPYTRTLLGRGTAEVRFVRDPGGTIRLEDGQDEDALEWLGSYHSGIARELSDAERKQFAPLGARKLYEAIKNKPLATLRGAER
jgi:hypothetical protein